MLCPLCGGSGRHVTFRWRGLTYWPCQACGETGVLAQHAPATFVRITPSQETGHG